MSHMAASLLIDGRRCEGRGAAIQVVNPATGEVIGALLGASIEDVDAAAAAAQRAFASWSGRAANDREVVLRRAAAAVRVMAPRIAGARLQEIFAVVMLLVALVLAAHAFGVF